MIGLDPEECRRPEFAAVFSGNAPVPQGVRPYAQNYGGHQFGMVLQRFAHCSESPLAIHMRPAVWHGALLQCILLRNSLAGPLAATQTPACDAEIPSSSASWRSI